MDNNADIFNNLLTRFHENKLAHAFLLESNDIDKCYLDVLEFVKNICKESVSDEVDIDSLVDNNNLPSLITIEPDGQFIKKEQILDMMERFSTKPVYTANNIYIIRNAERFNGSSANTLLKFLEEPEDNIIGIFITNNKETVINTIRSRCQIFSVYYDLDINSKLDDDVLTDVKLYLNNIYRNKEDLVYNRTHMSKLYAERIDWEIFFRTMLYYLKDCIVSERKDKIELVKSISQDNLVRIIAYIEEIIKYIKSNCNMDLVLDKFVIEMRRYYE